MLHIHLDDCVDCGGCAPVCRVEAISFEENGWVAAVTTNFGNEDFFSEVSATSKADPIPRGHLRVAYLPSRTQ